MPSFPKKKLIGNMKPTFIQKRMRKIETYLNQVIKFPGILDVPEVHTFLTTTISAKGEEEEALIERQKMEEEVEKKVDAEAEGCASAQGVPASEAGGRIEGQAPDEDAGQRKSRRINYRDILPKDNPAMLSSYGATPTTPDNTPADNTNPTAHSTSPEKRVSVFGMMSKKNQKNRETLTQPIPATIVTPETDTHPIPPPTTATPTTTTATPSAPEVQREKAVALWDFVSTNHSELGMLVNDVVTIYEKSSAEWWFGTVNGREFGFFPPAYVRLLPS